MNLAHVHLLLNHFPTVGFGIGVVLFVIALIGKSEDLKRASLGVLFLVAVLAIPAYVSGNAAQGVICKPAGEGVVECLPDVSQRAIVAHEGAAFVAFALMEVTGFLAWLALWYYRRISRVAGWNVAAVLILSLVTFALMSRAATIGGEIRHSEIVDEAAAAAAAAEGTATPSLARELGAYMVATTWLWPACEALHFIGLCLLFTTVLIVDLRILGIAKSLSFAAVYQLLPLGIVGFGINLVTGMMFFLASPGQYTENISFHWKILFVVVAGVNSLYFMLFDKAWAVGPGDDAPFTAKFMAVSAIILWIGVLVFGEMLPFLGNSF